MCLKSTQKTSVWDGDVTEKGRISLELEEISGYSNHTAVWL